jgi:transcriptional regulator with PAS, ATPase and Fis domain
MDAPLPAPDPRRVSNDPFERVLGSSRAAEAIRIFGRRAAAVDAPVLLLGESGTGKGVLARAIHDASVRVKGPFVAVNCAAIPDALFESEFFGHVRGAFTGAQYGHRGLFEQAHNGTLFLDEVGELPLMAQAKLLTAIEDRVVRKIGGERAAEVNLRILAATARSLERCVADGSFRQDLYHRLRILCYRIPALRERGHDVRELAACFLDAFRTRYGRPDLYFADDALENLAAREWPGNIRELANVIEAAVVASTGSVIVSEDLGGESAESAALESDEDEVTRIRRALDRFNGNKTRAAAALGMARTTLWQKLRRLDAGASDPNSTERPENGE